MEVDIISDEKNEIIFNILSGDHHSLGNLIQFYLKDDPNVEFFGFRQDHPLKDVSIFTLKVKKGLAKDTLKRVIDKIINEIENVKLQ